MWPGVVLLKDNATPEKLSEPILVEFSQHAVKIRRVDFGINAGIALEEFPEDNAFPTPPNGEHHLLLVGVRLKRW
ncbi:unnamed protein product [Heligmosomoides polygyrus]|uniref:Aldose 1-epimerase n=1 Tax=Heligmosomoides polygyrus TaxID=6339 RepID=A0A183G1E6_HELPZ|nr:unnamed protein product [Heligmosomoides polygyrus]